MFTAAAVTAVASFLGGDLLTLLFAKVGLGAAAGPAAKALIQVMKIVESHADHLSPAALEQIRKEAMASGQISRASMQGSWVPRTGGMQ